jgi:hypothetical protein
VAQQADLAGRGVFSRPASGLIRVAGSADVFIYNVGLVSVGIAIALNQYYGPSLYPGAGVWLSTLLAAAGMLAIAATFYFWSVIFPRSGGVYVSLSRGLSPGFAFVGSLVETVILLYYAAFAASLIVTVGLSSFLAHRRGGGRQPHPARLGRLHRRAEWRVLDRHRRAGGGRAAAGHRTRRYQDFAGGFRPSGRR